MLSGYSKLDFKPEAQEVFTIVTWEGLHFPTRVLQGSSNATTFLPSTIARLLKGLDCNIYIDDVLWYGDCREELFATLDEILTHLESVVFFAAVHNCKFLAIELS